MDDLEGLIKRIPRRPPTKDLDARMHALLGRTIPPHLVDRGFRTFALVVTAVAAMFVGCVVGFSLGRAIPSTASRGRASGEPPSVCQVELVGLDSSGTQPFVFASGKSHCVVSDIATRVTVSTGDGL